MEKFDIDNLYVMIKETNSCLLKKVRLTNFSSFADLEEMCDNLFPHTLGKVNHYEILCNYKLSLFDDEDLEIFLPSYFVYEGKIKSEFWEIKKILCQLEIDNKLGIFWDWFLYNFSSHHYLSKTTLTLFYSSYIGFFGNIETYFVKVLNIPFHLENYIDWEKLLNSCPEYYEINGYIFKK